MKDIPFWLKIHLFLAGIAVGVIVLALIGFFIGYIGENVARIAGMAGGYLIFVSVIYGRYNEEKEK